MKTNRTYNQCDECPYSYSKTGEESNICKICELTYFISIRPKEGKWIDIPDYFYQLQYSQEHSNCEMHNHQCQ